MDNEVDTLLLLRSRSRTMAKSNFVSSRGLCVFGLLYVLVFFSFFVAVAVFQSNSIRDMLPKGKHDCKFDGRS